MMEDSREEKIRKISDYILKDVFCLGDAAKLVEYSDHPDSEPDPEHEPETKIIIRRSDFWNEDVYRTKRSVPLEPLQCWRGTPILYGNAAEESGNGSVVLHADLIASAFFFLSRYEELINPERDQHGRFAAVDSVAGRGGFVERPVVDEYAYHIRDILKKLGVKLTEVLPGKIYLTHDMDSPWHWSLMRAVRKTAGNLAHLRKKPLAPVSAYLHNYRRDDYDTFDWLMSADNRLRDTYGDRVSEIYFMLGNRKDDGYTVSYLHDRRLGKLIEKLQANQCVIGLHVSYRAGDNSSYQQTAEEKKNIEKRTGIVINASRNHYLLSKDIHMFRSLIGAGIVHDFTMSYADHAGFRLGTSYAVHWIDPERLEITDLILHPLNVMDCTLTDACYMGLNPREAASKAMGIYQQCVDHGGDFCLLFHNSYIAPSQNSYGKKLYETIINSIAGKQENQEQLL